MNEIVTFYLPLHPVYFVRRRTELGGEMQILAACWCKHFTLSLVHALTNILKPTFE